MQTIFCNENFSIPYTLTHANTVKTKTATFICVRLLKMAARSEAGKGLRGGGGGGGDFSQWRSNVVIALAHLPPLNESPLRRLLRVSEGGEKRHFFTICFQKYG